MVGESLTPADEGYQLSDGYLWLCKEGLVFEHILVDEFLSS